MRTYNLEEAKALGIQFAQELELEFNVECYYWFIGSIRDGKYVEGSSDIDMVIIPKKEGMFGAQAIRRILEKMAEYKKYGTVFKKGRDISLIDVAIFLDLDMVNKVREMHVAQQGKAK